MQRRRPDRAAELLLPLIALLGFVAPTWGPRTARATGICEHTTTTFELRAVSEVAGELLVTGEEEWCEETEEVTEERGVRPFLQIRDFKGEVRRRSLVPEPDGGAKRAAGGTKGSAAATPASGTLKAQWQRAGFVEVAALGVSPSRRCSLRVEVGEREEPDDDFPSAPAKAAILIDGEPAHGVALGAFAVDEGSPAVTPLYLPKRRALVLWVVMPRCVGGPPPGYFGEDDPGDCYTGGEPEVHLIELGQAPRLAACFEAAAMPGPAGGAAVPRVPGSQDPAGAPVPAWATPREGPLRAEGKASQLHGRRPVVQVERLWAYSTESPDYRAVVRAKLGDGPITTVQVPDTPYALLLHAGLVQPLLLSTRPWALWQLDGLGPFFLRAAKVQPGERTVTVREVRGMVDLDLIWVLDLSDPKAGLVVRYDEEGGW